MKMTNKTKQEFFNIINNNQKFLLTTHVSADGDGLGAEAALSNYLNYKKKDFKIINNEKPQSKYQFLEISDAVELKPNDTKGRVLIILDCNEIERINKALEPTLSDFKKIIVIDHHRDPQNIQNSLQIIDYNASSVCEIVYLLLENRLDRIPQKMQQKIFQALYTGIIFDTNNFINSNVSKTTFCISGKMIEKGVDNTQIYRHIFEDKSNFKIKLLGHTLATLQEFHHGEVVVYKTTQKMLEKTHTKMEDTSGFTKEVRPDEFRKIVVYIREISKNECRVSLRSKKFNVQKIAKKFGGGGHKLAAGFKTKTNLPDLQTKLLDLILSYHS